MAIAKMRKFTLLTFAANKVTLLKEMQKFEGVHFKSLEAEKSGENSEGKSGFALETDISAAEIDLSSTELEKIKFALTKIEPYAQKPKGVKALTTPPPSIDYGEFDKFADSYDYKSVYEAVQKETARQISGKSEITKLKSENEALRAWIKLDVSPDTLNAMRFVKYLIGTVNKQQADALCAEINEKHPQSYIEALGSIKDDVAMLIFAAEGDFESLSADCKELGFARASVNFKGVPSEEIDKNNKRIEELQESMADAENNIKKLNAEYDNLKIAYDYYETLLEREKARNNFLKTNTSVIIEGWVPEDNAEAFRALAKNACGDEYYLEDEAVDKNCEEVPIKLKNNAVITAFEGVTEMFSMPKYNDIDPTPLLMPFYMLFFGFMMGDAGYGLLLLVATSFALKFCHFKQSTRRFIKFFFFLSMSTIFAGFIYGSAFGFAFFTPMTGADGMPKAILDSQADVILMMLLSVAIGAVHVLFGLLVKGYVMARNGDPMGALFDSGFWFIAVLSGIGWLLGITGTIPASTGNIFMWVFYASLVALAATQGRSSESLGAKIGNGLYSVYGISGYVGDLVSYTRIAAIALSGAYIAFSFNLMVGLIPAGIFRIVFGSIVFLLGMFLNIGLGALGAYVHTCRLQYVEFFGKFYEGGGVPFNPFKLKNKYITIKK